MISLLRSKFSRGPKRAICVAAEAITVYHWQNGDITDSFQFDADDTGRFHFSRYLKETPVLPSYMLVDMVEEEFRQDTIPHVKGSDRKNILQRKLNRSFRNSPYTHYLMQGRQTEGRKDDKVLLTALTNTEAITPWVTLLEENQVPLAGIYSLPIMSKQLLKPIQAKSTNTLLVTLGASSGLRQSYFRDGQIQISRLAKLPRFGTTPYGPYVLNELHKLSRYLNNLRLLSREEPLDIYILAHGEMLLDLSHRIQDTGLNRYHLIDVASLSHDMGVEGVLTTPFSDYLYAHMLLSNPPKNHYGSVSDTHYFSIHQARLALSAMSILVLLGSSTWAGFNFISGISLKQKSLQTSQDVDYYLSRYEIERKDLPPTAVQPADIQSAINIVDSLQQHKSTPFVMMRSISLVLNDYPQLQIDDIHWLVDSDPNKRPYAVDNLTDDIETLERNEEYDFYQIAQIKGHLSSFDGDYREALDMVHRFADSLRSKENVFHVVINNLPLDISPQSRLSGGTEGQHDRSALFALTIVLGMRSET